MLRRVPYLAGAKLIKIQRIYVCSSCKTGDGDARVAEAMSHLRALSDTKQVNHDSALAQRLRETDLVQQFERRDSRERVTESRREPGAGGGYWESRGMTCV